MNVAHNLSSRSSLNVGPSRVLPRQRLRAEALEGIDRDTLARWFLDGVATVDTEAPVTGILAEADCTLNVVLNSLESVAQDRPEVSHAFTVLLALQRRLKIAADLCDHINTTNADACEEAPTSAPRPRDSQARVRAVDEAAKELSKSLGAMTPILNQLGVMASPIKGFSETPEGLRDAGAEALERAEKASRALHELALRAA